MPSRWSTPGNLGLSDEVNFILGDVLETPFPDKFDIIWSRDALMHIPDKARLFATASQPARGRGSGRDHRLRPGQDTRLARHSRTTSSRRATTS